MSVLLTKLLFEIILSSMLFFESNVEENHIYCTYIYLNVFVMILKFTLLYILKTAHTVIILYDSHVDLARNTYTKHSYHILRIVSEKFT